MDLFSLPRPLGFVLGGGGSLGAVQVGMLRALAERDLFPDLVVGTSVGSLNGAVVALDPTGAANRLSGIWPRITRQMVFPGGPLAQLRTLQQGPTHLFPNTALQALIRVHLAANAHFAELALPFRPFEDGPSSRRGLRCGRAAPGGHSPSLRGRPFIEAPASAPSSTPVASLAVHSGTALHRGGGNDTPELWTSGNSPSLRGRPFIEASTSRTWASGTRCLPSLRGRPFIEAGTR